MLSFVIFQKISELTHYRFIALKFVNIEPLIVVDKLHIFTEFAESTICILLTTLCKILLISCFHFCILSPSGSVKLFYGVLFNKTASF